MSSKFLKENSIFSDFCLKLYNFFPHLGATSDTENDPENITNTDDEIEEQVEKLKLNRKSVGHRKALETALAMIHRAPTPAKVGKSLQENGDFKKKNSYPCNFTNFSTFFRKY